jgi:protocatechuate 3,4-dioxygenase beta subunit
MNFLGALLLWTLGQLQTPPSPAVLRGSVSDAATGQPVKRATVTLYPQGKAREAVTHSSDDQGVFEFKNVSDGVYTLDCAKAGYVAASYESPLTVHAGQELKDLSFRLIKSASIEGTVLDENRDPLNESFVQLMTRSFADGAPRFQARKTTVTDDRGHYRFFGLPAGRYYVVASGPQQWRNKLTFGTVWYPGAASAQAAQTLLVAKGSDVTGVDFRLSPARALTISERVFDRTGKIATQGLLQFEAANEGLGSLVAVPVRSDGSFSTRGVLPGCYRVQVSVTGRPLGQVIDFTDNVSNLVLREPAGVAVHGKIVPAAADEKFSDETDCHLQLTARDSFSLARDPTAESAGDGFHFGVVEPGNYRLSLTCTNATYLREVRMDGRDVLKDGITVNLDVSPSTLEAITASDGGDLTARAVTEKGEPLPRSQVVLLSADKANLDDVRYFHKATTGEGGSVTFHALVPGDYLLFLWPRTDTGALSEPELFDELKKVAMPVTVEKKGSVSRELTMAAGIEKLAVQYP